jgi:hypothetical protein
MQFIASKISGKFDIDARSTTGNGGWILDKDTVNIEEVRTSGCSLTLTQREVKTRAGSVGAREEDWVWTVTFSMKRILLGSTKLYSAGHSDTQDGGYRYVHDIMPRLVISFSAPPIEFTQYYKSMVKRRGEWQVLHEENMNDKLNEKSFWFSDVDIEGRVSKAIEHAARLCGASKEPF